MLTLLLADRVRVGLSQMYFDIGSNGLFDRQYVVLPDVQLPTDVAAEVALKPVFDLMAHSCGLRGSLNYDEQGNRAPAR